MMQTFLDEFAKTIPDTDHVALFLDQAGWHGAKALKVPDCITLLPLPPYSPELNPVERIWEYLKERYLSHRLLDDYDAIEAAITVAWKKNSSRRPAVSRRSRGCPGRRRKPKSPRVRSYDRWFFT